MKIHDFGLWFRGEDDKGMFFWSSTIPQARVIYILYDSAALACHAHGFFKILHPFKPHIIKLKKKFAKHGPYYNINRLITLEDFEITENPDYRGIK
jgi:hypothetical protein